MRHGNDKGIVLVMVMWVLTVLMVIVLSFSAMARTEANTTLAYRDEVRMKYLAEAGIERGIVELMYRRSKSGVAGNVTEEGDILKVDGTYYSFETAGGAIRLRLINESGKVDINAAPELLLKNLIGNLGVKDKELDIVVDSIMDWKDADSLTRLNGAEDDYYQSLPNPYKAKNANFDSLGELLLVRGMTRDLFYGSGGKKGLADLLTLYSGSASINLNAAPREVLAAIPGMNDALADAVISYREAKEIRSLDEVKALLGTQFNVMSPYIAVGEGSAYTVEAEGRSGTRTAAYAVKAVVMLEGEKYRYVYYKNPEGMRLWNVH